MIEVDNYSIQCYRDCPRSYFWRIERGLVKPTEKKTAAEFGTAIHKALETYYHGGCTQDAIDKALIAFTSHYTPFETFEDNKRTIMKGLEILDKYFERYQGEPFNVIATEVGGAFELGAYLYRTRLDLIAEWQAPKGIYVFDHKTSSDIGRLVSKPHNQLTGYEYNVRELYENVLGTQLNILGVYVSDEMMDKNAPKVESKKSGKMIYATQKREIFLRMVTSRTPQELSDWKKETLFVLSEIERSREEGMWPKYTDYCSAYKSRCWYLDLCNASNKDVVERLIEGGIYQVSYWKPYETEGDEGDE